MSKEQAKIILSLSSFEIDMSFKRFKRKEIKELVIAIYQPEHDRSKYFFLSNLFIKLY